MHQSPNLPFSGIRQRTVTWNQTKFRRALTNVSGGDAPKPKLAAQWHTTKNGDLEPDQVPPRSNKRVWWRCTKGHDWSATVLNRSGGSGCPYCSGRRPTPERTLAALRPDLVAQWHPNRNEVRPECGKGAFGCG